MHRLLPLLLILPLSAGTEPGELAPAETDFTEPEPADRFSLPDLFGGVQSLDLETEALLSDDIDVWRTSARYTQDRRQWSIEAGLSYFDYSVDYQPFIKYGGTPTKLDESTWQGDLTFGYQLREGLESTVTVRAYDGFADYRSVWIAEYYRQNFEFPGSGYMSPDPHGWSLAGGFVWDPRIGTRLGLDLIYGEDTIAPGWDTPSSSGIDLLKTRAVALRWEQAVNPRLKTETSFLYNDITDRDPRLHLQSQWAASLTDDLVLRAHAGAATEDPDFDSLYGGLALDYQISPAWSVSVQGRLYDDSGEIENSGFSTAAPGLESWELGASLLYDHGDHAVRLGLSYYDTAYDAVDGTNDFFANLYADRDWWTIRLAYTLNF